MIWGLLISLEILVLILSAICCPAVTAHLRCTPPTAKAFLPLSSDLSWPRANTLSIRAETSSSYPEIQVTFLSPNENTQAATSVLPDFLSPSDKMMQTPSCESWEGLCWKLQFRPSDPISHNNVLARGPCSWWVTSEEVTFNMCPPSGYSCTPLSFAQIVGLL